MESKRLSLRAKVTAQKDKNLKVADEIGFIFHRLNWTVFWPALTFILILLFFTSIASAQKVAEFKETQFADAHAALEGKRQVELKSLDTQINAKLKEYEGIAKKAGNLDLVLLIKRHYRRM